MPFQTEFRKRNELNAAPGCVLFVEDNPHDYELAVRELKKVMLRNTMMCVRNADEMLVYLRAVYQYLNPEKYPLPSIIILDLHLPGSDVLEAQSMLRASARFRRIPLVTISSNEEALLLKASFELGAEASMTKPFNSTDFMAIVDKLNLRLDFSR